MRVKTWSSSLLKVIWISFWSSCTHSSPSFSCQKKKPGALIEFPGATHVEFPIFRKCLRPRVNSHSSQRKTLDEVVLFSLCSNSFSGLFLKIPVVLQVLKLNRSLSKDPTTFTSRVFFVPGDNYTYDWGTHWNVEHWNVEHWNVEHLNVEHWNVEHWNVTLFTGHICSFLEP